MISGLLVLIAGIPAGLYLDSLRRKSEERIKENEDKEQEIIVLKALLEELGNSNEFFLFQRKGVSTSVVADRMSVEVWDTFKSSSRLNYIDNSFTAWHYVHN
jgi:hypothetical protein